MTRHSPRRLASLLAGLALLSVPAPGLEAQLKVGPHLSMRPAAMEIEGLSVAEFARSLQVRTETGEPVPAICMATIYDSEGNAWRSWASEEVARVGDGEGAACWSREMAELLPDGRFGPNDRVLSPGLIVNADYLTAHSLPVTSDVPVDPFILSDELRFATPRFEGTLEEVGRPMEPRFGMETRAEWVAVTFMVIPMADPDHPAGDSGGPLSEEFETRPVTVLLGARER